MTSPIVTEAPKLLREQNRALNPTRVFVDRNRLAFFWFVVATLAVGVAILEPFYLIAKMKERERIVVLDPSGTYHISPLLDFEEAKDLHAQQASLAASAFLNVSPSGFDQAFLLERLFLKRAHGKAKAYFSQSLSKEFDAKQLHQKSEISQIDILETREDFVLSQVTGQLVRTGVFQNKTFSEAIPFTLVLKMVRNPDLSKNGRFPTAVHDFRYETD